VAGVPEDVGTAGALRSVAHHLTANDVLVKSFFHPSKLPLPRIKVLVAIIFIFIITLFF